MVIKQKKTLCFFKRPDKEQKMNGIRGFGAPDDASGKEVDLNTTKQEGEGWPLSILKSGDIETKNYCKISWG